MAPEPLKIVIIGAGIGGLTAGLGLRQQGHQIILLEQASFATETGLAIHVTPNCYGVLARLGLRVEDCEANNLTGLDDYASSGSLVSSFDYTAEIAACWRYPWMLVHRVNLHQKLKQLATDNRMPGMPILLNTSSRVTSIDYEHGIATCVNGDRYHADVIIGADGVRSVARNFVTDEEVLPRSSEKAAYRFILSISNLRMDPKTSWFVSDGRFKMVTGNNRKLIAYPCNNNNLMSCLYAFPSSEGPEFQGSMYNYFNLGYLLKSIDSFGPDIKAIFAHVQRDDLKCWELLDMDPLPTWVRGRLALLGDAAHPFLPWLGQGGAMAIEDAASLAAVLPFGTRSDEIYDRLKLYEKCRYDRANKIQEKTRSAGEGTNMAIARSSMAFAFSHNEWDHSMYMLKLWRWNFSTFLPWHIPCGVEKEDSRRERALAKGE